MWDEFSELMQADSYHVGSVKNWNHTEGRGKLVVGTQRYEVEGDKGV